MAENSAIPCRIDGKANPAYFRAYYARNKEHISSYNSKRRKANKYHGVNNQLYREMVVSLLWERDGDLCGVCNEKLDPANMQVDHKIPKCLGGVNTASNLQLAHKECNQAKPRNRGAYFDD